MTNPTESTQIGKEIRATHHYAFRSGEWASLLGRQTTGDHGACYVVEFKDGRSDLWPVNDSQAGYEYRG
jgi:hypothetical protein